ncbi:hypothetical protein ACWEQL_00010 [Kitasatospora sp. NPDC004240]
MLLARRVGARARGPAPPDAGAGRRRHRAGHQPGGDGRLVEELAHDLAADTLTHSAGTDGALPQLATGERIALIAVCALAAAMPGTVLNDLTRELPALADTMDAAVQASRTAHPDTGELGDNPAADAVERAAGREVVPGGGGQLDEELAYDLSADVVTGSVVADGLPGLSMGERIALVAVCALAASVLGELERELPVLASTMQAATDAGIAAGPQ